MTAVLLNKLSGQGFYEKDGKIALKTVGAEITFSKVTGIAVGVRNESELNISGGGGSISTDINTGRTYGSMSGISSSTTWYLYFFIRDEQTGVERPYKLTDSSVVLRDGHRITALFSHYKKKTVLIGIVNHSTNMYYPFYSNGNWAKIKTGVARIYGNFMYLPAAFLGPLIVTPITLAVLSDYVLSKSFIKGLQKAKMYWPLFMGITVFFVIAVLSYWIYEFIRLFYGSKKFHSQLGSLFQALF